MIGNSIGRKQDALGCPSDPVLKILSGEWAPHVIWTLGRNGPTRFSALRRALPGTVSARMLTVRLRELEDAGLVSRTELGRNLSRVQYALTEVGERVDVRLAGLEPHILHGPDA